MLINKNILNGLGKNSLVGWGMYVKNSNSISTVDNKLNIKSIDGDAVGIYLNFDKTPKIKIGDKVSLIAMVSGTGKVRIGFDSGTMAWTYYDLTETPTIIKHSYVATVEQPRPHIYSASKCDMYIHWISETIDGDTDIWIPSKGDLPMSVQTGYYEQMFGGGAGKQFKLSNCSTWRCSIC